MPLENFMTSVSACSSSPVSRRTSAIRRARSAARDFVERGKEVEVLARRQTREERALRGDGDADLPPDLAGIASRIEAAHAHRSRIGQQHGRDQLKGRGLPAAVWTEQHQDLRRAQRKKKFFQGNRFAAPLPSQPIEQSGTMAKYLANGFEDDSGP